MTSKIVCYGCRDYEKESFEKLGKMYGYHLVLKSEFLTNDNVQDAFGYENIMIRGNCFLDGDSLRLLKEHGLKYLLTRTVGFNHIDLATAQAIGLEVANVPSYSPNAVAELAVTFAMMLLRNVSYATFQCANADFRVTSKMFSKEIRSCTVGIIGCGRIGRTTASLFKALGANVVGYDVNQNLKSDANIKYVDIDELLSVSDIISCHIPYIKNVNDNFINKDMIGKMKDGTILINTSRGEILDLKSAVDAVKNNKLGGLAVDVISNELDLFFKVWHKEDLKDTLYGEMIELYPQVLITPHIGSSTQNALNDMIEISLQNLKEYQEKGFCSNSLLNHSK